MRTFFEDSRPAKPDAAPPLAAGPDIPARYNPYAIDWRFLPEPALILKDTVRHALAAASNAAAVAPPTRQLWANTLGRRTLDAVIRAGRLFVHIPKTGGTSVCAGLYGRNLPHYTHSFYTAAYGDRIAGLPSFSVVREPVGRLLSAYRFIRAGGSAIMATSHFERAQLPRLVSFADFVAHLARNPATIGRLVSLRPQSGYILDAAGNFQVDRVFLNEGDGDLPGLADYLGIDRIPRLNASLLPPEPVDGAVRATIETLYAADFELVERVRRLASNTAAMELPASAA